jgi:hypothetical protein
MDIPISSTRKMQSDDRPKYPHTRALPKKESAVLTKERDSSTV